jgi:hypothetical protein
MLRGLIAREGLKDRVSSLRYVSIPVLDLAGIDKLIAALISESKQAIDADGAGVIVLGCTAMVGVKEAVEKGLKADGYNVTVIEAAENRDTYTFPGSPYSRITKTIYEDSVESFFFRLFAHKYDFGNGNRFVIFAFNARRTMANVFAYHLSTRKQKLGNILLHVFCPNVADNGNQIQNFHFFSFLAGFHRNYFD